MCKKNLGNPFFKTRASKLTELPGKFLPSIKPPTLFGATFCYCIFSSPRCYLCR